MRAGWLAGRGQMEVSVLMLFLLKAAIAVELPVHSFSSTVSWL